MPTKPLGMNVTAQTMGDPPPARSALNSRTPWVPQYDDAPKPKPPKAAIPHRPRGRAGALYRTGPRMTKDILKRVLAAAASEAGSSVKDIKSGLSAKGDKPADRRAQAASRARTLAALALGRLCPGSRQDEIAAAVGANSVTYLSSCEQRMRGQPPKWWHPDMLERIVSAVEKGEANAPTVIGG